jgi:hypothetical protein
MISAPTTVPEWEAYVEDLSREALWSKCRAANSFQFTKALITEGMTMAELERVMLLFVRRMIEMEIKLPEGGAFPLHHLAKRDPLASF